MIASKTDKCASYFQNTKLLFLESSNSLFPRAFAAFHKKLKFKITKICIMLLKIYWLKKSVHNILPEIISFLKKRGKQLNNYTQIYIKFLNNLSQYHLGNFKWSNFWCFRMFQMFYILVTAIELEIWSIFKYSYLYIPWTWNPEHSQYKLLTGSPISKCT